jgi:cell division protein FtsW
MYRVALLLVASLIFSIGLVMIFSTSSAEVLDNDLAKSMHHALLRQIIYAVTGVAVAVGFWKLGYRRFLRWSPLFFKLSILLLILTLIPGLGKEVNGSRRWLGVAGFTFQPSELAKYCIPAFFVYRISLFQEKRITFLDFLKLMGMIAIPILLILVEPNNGTAAVIGMTVLALCLITCIPFKFWALPLCIFVVVGGVFASQLPYVTARLKVYLHPETDLQGKGHQPYQAKIASGSGKLLGKGPGNSWQKLSYLPEAQNDYIAAIYAEEFGFLGILTLIILYMGIAYLGFSIAMTAPDASGVYYASAVSFLICFQAFLNLGVVSGLLPSTGLNLPLFSQGGTSLIANILGIGILLNIAATGEAAHEM